jgi:uncharacterized protein YbdZ (MbtH family)
MPEKLMRIGRQINGKDGKSKFHQAESLKSTIGALDRHWETLSPNKNRQKNTDEKKMPNR